MIEKSDPQFSEFQKECAEELELLRQNRLLKESAFLRFARDRGLPVAGVVTGDPGRFHERGWLVSDRTDPDANLLFHPFRIYPLHLILETCKLNIVRSAAIDKDSFLRLIQHGLPHVANTDRIQKEASEANLVVDLAMLLEPIYWPFITGLSSRSAFIPESEHATRAIQYREKVLGWVPTLDPNTWQQKHKTLRIQAARMDGNPELYLLLRVSRWTGRERLKGLVSGALWLRHIAETIRLAFEEVHEQHWQEEDQAFGFWPQGARKRAFGSERPLDDVLQSRHYLASSFGLFTGSLVRWYVEGDTEYYAVIESVGDPHRFGVELVNLRGNIKSERDNAALKLEDWLKEDKALRRFSIISVDLDVTENVKAIRRQVREDNIVGSISPHDPDFEFANFSVRELVEVAAEIDELHGFSGDTVRKANWDDVKTGRAFEEAYSKVSERTPGSLKGEEWGRGLAKLIKDHPNREDDGRRRPFLDEIRGAVLCRFWNYDSTKESRKFDEKTLQQIDREPEVESSKDLT